jgi:mannosyltransferase OCH1-like enzyme
MPKFSKNIFQVWFQGCENITRSDFNENIKNWKILNPTWNYQCVNDDFLKKACLEFSKECYDAYINTDIMHVKIDLGRYVLIYLYGGIYVDMDAYVLRGLHTSKYVNDLIDVYEKQKKHVIGLSEAPHTMLESYVSVQHHFTLNNAIMMSSPKNPVLEKYIKHVINKINEHMDNSIDMMTILSTTGPTEFNRFFTNQDNVKDSEIVIFNSDVFEACDLLKNCNITNDTVSIHVFELSWQPPFYKFLSSIYLFFKQYIYLIIIIILLVYIYRKKL